MPVVTFSPERFRAACPQYAAVPVLDDARLEQGFNLACLILDNSENSCVPYAPPQVMVRETLLFLLVAHFCELAERGEGGAGAVGGVASASEGSVSVSFSLPQQQNAAWFSQTAPGLAFWQATLKYRMGGRWQGQKPMHPWG